jgi:hypothetical protein
MASVCHDFFSQMRSCFLPARPLRVSFHSSAALDQSLWLSDAGGTDHILLTSYGSVSCGTMRFAADDQILDITIAIRIAFPLLDSNLEANGGRQQAQNQRLVQSRSYKWPSEDCRHSGLPRWNSLLCKSSRHFCLDVYARSAQSRFYLR